MEGLLCSQGALLKLKKFAEAGPWTLCLLEVYMTDLPIAHQMFYSTNDTLPFKHLFH